MIPVRWLSCLAALVLVMARHTVAAVPLSFSVPGGVYTNDVNLLLTARLPSEVIRFTLDGTEPTAQSAVYSSALTITNSVLVRARAFQAQVPSGPIVSETYILLDPDLWSFSSNLPLVVINTFGQIVSHESKTPVSVRFIDRGPGGRSTLTGSSDFQGRALINIRGHSSLRFPKHSYGLRIRDETGNSLKAPVLGFPADSNWILSAPYSDKTLMRDVLAYDLSNQIGQYAPRTQFVEVFASRSGQKLSRRSYAGLYVLEEKIKRAKQRVNIQKLTPEDNQEPEISGGYIFKKDHEDNGAGGGFTTSQGIHFFYVDPKDRELTRRQKAWLAGYLNRFEKALYGPDFKDPVRGYAAYLEPESFIDIHWMVELSKNIDGYQWSNFLHKDRMGKLKAGPIWDYNLSFGNANYREGWVAEGWYWSLISERDHLWFGRLFKDPDFQQKHIDRWAQLRTNQFAASNILAKVDALSVLLQEAQERNFKRWRILGQQVWPNWYVGQTYAEEVNWMKQWIKQRIAWIDKQFPLPPTATFKSSPQTSERLLSLRASGGKIYYTLDGSDPRASGGAVSAKAKAYREAIALGAQTAVLARVQTANGWSAPVVCGPKE